MDFVRADVDHLDAIIKALGRLRFDVNGTECMTLADHLAWVGQLRAQANAEAVRVEEKAAARLKAALALYDARQNPLPESAPTPPPIVAAEAPPSPAPPPSPRRLVKPRG